MRKLMLIAIVALLAFAIAIPVVAPDTIDLVAADVAGITIDDSYDTYQVADPPCPPGSTGANC